MDDLRVQQAVFGFITWLCKYELEGKGPDSGLRYSEDALREYAVMYCESVSGVAGQEVEIKVDGMNLSVAPLIALLPEQIEVADEQQAVNRFAAEFGFEQWHTGGGCTALGLYRTSDIKGEYIMVTSENGAVMPTELGEHCTAWHYNGQGKEVALDEIGAGLPFHELMNGPVNELIRGWER